MLCREHGRQLTEFAATLEGKVHVWGTVKETGVDDEGLYDFYNRFYTFPLYRDVTLAIYTAFGSRRIALTTWNPWRLWNGYQELKNRMTDQRIKGNYKGEGMIQGGVLVFDAAGTLRYAYEEDIGTPLEVEDIRAAINAVLDGDEPAADAAAKEEL